MRNRFLGAVAMAGMASMVLAGCGGGADPAAVVDAVRATEQSQLQSLAAKDLTGIVRLYADDATLVRPDGSVLVGATAIVDDYAQLIADPNFSITVEPTAGWGSASDDLAVLASNVDFTTSDPATGQPTTLPMSSKSVWTRETGGTWKIVAAINSPRQPDAAAATPAAGAGATPAAPAPAPAQ